MYLKITRKLIQRTEVGDGSPFKRIEHGISSCVLMIKQTKHNKYSGNTLICDIWKQQIIEMSCAKVMYYKGFVVFN